MEQSAPIYNSRITKVYLEYLKSAYPEVDQEEILAVAGMKRYEVEDPAHWLTQEQVDRFHHALVVNTGNSGISREAGRYATSAKGMGPLRQYALGLLKPSHIYKLAGKIYAMMSRAASMEAKELGPNKVEIICTPKAEVQEKLYQCEYRIGTLESLARLFSDKRLPRLSTLSASTGKTRDVFTSSNGKTLRHWYGKRSVILPCL